MTAKIALAALLLVPPSVALAEAPSDLAIRLARSGERMWRAGRFEQASEAWALAAAANPEHVPALLGAARFARARFDDALELHILERAFRLAPRDRALARELGRALARQEPARAHRLLERYLKMPPAGDSRATIAAARATAHHLAEQGARGPASVPAEPEAFELPLRRVAMSYLVAARIGAPEAVEFVLDSGSASLSIERETAERLGIRGFARGLSFGLGGAGEIGTLLADLPRLRLGPLERRHVPAYIGHFRTPHESAGLLPLLLFAGYQVTIDGERGSMQLRQGGRASAPPRATVLPLWRVGEHLAIAATLGGRSLTVLVDTGASTNVLDRRQLDTLVGAEVRARARAASVRGVGGAADALELELAEPLHLGGEEITSRRVVALDLRSATEVAGVAVDGLLGATLLESRRVTFDLARGSLWLEPVARAQEPLQRGPTQPGPLRPATR